MSDIFREVEEEVRRERLAQIWKKYGDYIVAAISLIILAAAGYRLWTYYEARQQAQASVRYIAAEDLLHGGQPRAAAKEFAEIAKSAPGGYAKLAQMQTADALAMSGDNATAVSIYRKLIADDDGMISAIARLRAAWIAVETEPKSAVEALLGPLTGASSAWRPLAQEVLAYADYRSGATKQALAEFQSLANDAKAPNGVRGRSKAMAVFLGAGGNRNVGTVPFPVQPKPSLLQQLKPKTPAAAAKAPASAANPPAPTAKALGDVEQAPAKASETAPNPSKGASPK